VEADAGAGAEVGAEAGADNGSVIKGGGLRGGEGRRCRRSKQSIEQKREQERERELVVT